MGEVADDMLDFYASRYEEDARLRQSPHGRLELARMRELLDRFVPPAPGTAIDAGGGPGVHAEWLAARGYDVELIDAVPHHVTQAARIAGVNARHGDARHLPFPDASADAVLLLGPLYHLLERADRLDALQEARRVAKPGAPVLAAAISRHTPVIDLANERRLDDATEPLARQAIEIGRHDGALGFTAAHLHTAEELADEMRAAGFADPDVLGIEGPLWPALDAHGIERVDETLPAAVRAARIVERDPLLLAASAHLLAVAHR
jgi:ubiquinone/menaquinone biosynthesis C-methylase UbiE